MSYIALKNRIKTLITEEDADEIIKELKTVLLALGCYATIPFVFQGLQFVNHHIDMLSKVLPMLKEPMENTVKEIYRLH